MPTVHNDPVQVNNVHAILVRAGFQLRRNRATCPYCRDGHKRPGLTVAIHGDLFFCHRCKRGGSVRGLARGQGIELPPPRIRKADAPKAAFRTWLADRMTELSREEWRLRRGAQLANVALRYFPDMELAWDALAAFHHRERFFITLWESASDKIGRYWLYRMWRKHANV